MKETMKKTIYVVTVAIMGSIAVLLIPPLFS